MDLISLVKFGCLKLINVLGSTRRYKMLSFVLIGTNKLSDPKVINAIKWSRGLDRVFIDNYNRDPTLSWQYFGSSAGFMRQYPGKQKILK